MTLSFAVRLRAHSAGLEAPIERLLRTKEPSDRSTEDLLALAGGPLPLLAAVVSQLRSKEAAVVGLLPAMIAGDAGAAVEEATRHRAFAEAELIDLSLGDGATMTSVLDAIRSLLEKLPGAQVRLEVASLLGLAEGVGLDPADAAAQLAEAGVRELERGALAYGAGERQLGPLPIRERVVVPEAIDASWIDSIRGATALKLVPGENTTGVVLLRAAALAHLVGATSIAVGGEDELKGPDGCLAFGADRLEAQLDPPGAMGSRTRAYGEAAIRGAQLTLLPPSRRAAATKRVAHILDEDVDAALLPGGDAASPTSSSSKLEVRS